MISFGEMESLAAEAQYGAERARRAAAAAEKEVVEDVEEETVEEDVEEDVVEEDVEEEEVEEEAVETPEERAARINREAEQIRADSLAAERAARQLADKARREENAALRQGAARDVMGSLLRDMFGNDPRFANEVAALTTQLNDLMIKGASELEIVQEIRGSTKYATRFPGMAARAEAGMPAISEREYIDLERNYRNLMRTSGIEERFYQDPARFG